MRKALSLFTIALLTSLGAIADEKPAELEYIKSIHRPSADLDLVLNTRAAKCEFRLDSPIRTFTFRVDVYKNGERVHTERNGHTHYATAKAIESGQFTLFIIDGETSRVKGVDPGQVEIAYTAFLEPVGSGTTHRFTLSTDQFRAHESFTAPVFGERSNNTREPNRQQQDYALRDGLKYEIPIMAVVGDDTDPDNDTTTILPTPESLIEKNPSTFILIVTLEFMPNREP